LKEGGEIAHTDRKWAKKGIVTSAKNTSPSLNRVDRLFWGTLSFSPSPLKVREEIESNPGVKKWETGREDVTGHAQRPGSKNLKKGPMEKTLPWGEGSLGLEADPAANTRAGARRAVQRARKGVRCGELRRAI